MEKAEKKIRNNRRIFLLKIRHLAYDKKIAAEKNERATEYCKQASRPVSERATLRLPALRLPAVQRVGTESGVSVPPGWRRPAFQRYCACGALRYIWK